MITRAGSRLSGIATNTGCRAARQSSEVNELKRNGLNDIRATSGFGPMPTDFAAFDQRAERALDCF